MKRIINLSIRYFPSPGGAEYLNKVVVDKLRASGQYEFKILTTYLGDHIADKKIMKSAELLEADAINSIVRKNSYKIPGTVYHIIPGFFESILPQCEFDIIHSWAMMYFPALAGALIKKIKNKPFIMNPIVDENNLAYRKKYSDTIGKYSISRCDHLILLTEYSLDILNRYGFKINNYDVIPAGVDFEEFDIETEKSIYCDENFFNILFTGRLAHGKGIDLLLKSISTLRETKEDFILHIAGPDFGELPSILEFIEKNNIKNNVRIHGNLPRRELIKLFKSADLFVLPSRYEAFGIVIIEAMAAGIPVIASNISAIPYIIKDGENGLLFEPENHNELAEKIKYLMGNDSAAKSLSSTAMKIVREKYSWDRVSEMYMGVYRKYS